MADRSFDEIKTGTIFSKEHKVSFLPLILLVIGAFVAWKLFTRSTPSQESQPTTSRVPEPEPRALSSPSLDQDEATDSDAWEGWFIEEAADPKPVKARLQISYVDGGGKATERVIKVQEFDNSEANCKAGLIMAFCEKRSARRTFRYERIRKAVDMETGEVIQDVQPYLRKIWIESPERSLEQFEGKFQGPLEVLLFIARADGRLVAKERAVIRDFCRKHLPDRRITDEDLTDSIKEVRALSLYSFKVATGHLLKEAPEVAVDVVKAAEEIVAAEKSVHPAEVEALEYLKKRLGKALIASQPAN